MAGIGFELRKLMRKDSYLSLFQAYAYAGVISSGPWILSIIAVIFIGIVSVPVVAPPQLVSQFQTAVTYVIALSLILTGFVQLALTRYCADRIFEQEHYRLIPSLNGAIFIVTTVSGLLAFPLSILLFDGQSLFFRVLLATVFVVMCDVWIAAILLSGLKAYRAVLLNFAAGYGTAFLLSFLLRSWNLEGLMLAFLTGQFVLLIGMLLVVYRYYPSTQFLGFDFLKKGRIYHSLVLTGFFYNLGIWADKMVFWFHPYTGAKVIGPMRASEIYDLPIFLAYLAIVPGMAVFLARMETDFVEYYDKFYDAVREGGTLGHICEMKDEMVRMAREGIYDIVKIQSIAAIGVFLLGRQLLGLARIDELYLPLLYVDVAGASFQVVFLGIINVFFYLDRRKRVLSLVILFASLNFVLSVLSIIAGPFFYGYGFALSLVVSIFVGMILLDRDLRMLEYETFMLR
ncbi:MAG TPA: exopolysaccharide Pel transporter PelG [Geobacteraceae bacterium]|nr:exopolysaccharide Pel transporter PelG [Geobacteraceae bacterium]